MRPKPTIRTIDCRACHRPIIRVVSGNIIDYRHNPASPVDRCPAR